MAILDSVRALYQAGRFDEAINLLEAENGMAPIISEILLLKGRLVQMSESGHYPISVAKACFEEV